MDPKLNGHLHVACLGYAQSEDVPATRERAVLQLLKLGFILEEKNAKGETCLDLAVESVRAEIMGKYLSMTGRVWFKHALAFLYRI